MSLTHYPKILIVDDYPENLFTLQKLLKQLEVEIFPANSGNEALGLTLEHDFFVAILDVQMSGMDGFELAELLRGNASTATLPIIFVSAVFSDEYHHRKGYEAGAVDFISKPFVPEILLSKIKIFLDLYQQRQVLETTVAQLDSANRQFALVNRELETTVEQLGRANSQFALVNQELETFSYSISHDLRAPLRAIDGFSHRLEEALGEMLNPETRRYLNIIHDNAQQMNELIDGLLQFSRLAFEPLASRKIEMKELAEHVLQDLHIAQPGRSVAISLADLPTAWGDPLLIRQVFANLLQNAFKYSRQRETAQIEIGFCAHGEQTAYFVGDNGVGFDMLYAGKLFGVFQRLHSVNEFDGIGIGLANVRRIILRHGGQVWAEARVDQGATFYFTLPKTAGQTIQINAHQG